MLVGLVLAACSKSEPTPGEGGATGAEAATAAADGAAGASREPLRLAELAVADMVPEDVRIPGFQAIADKAVQDAFIDPDHSFARAAEDDAGACKAQVQIGYALMVNGRPVADADAGSARAVIEIEVFCPDPSHAGEIEAYRLTLDDERSFGESAGGSSKGRLEEVVRQVAKDGAEGVYGQARTRHADDARILANLAQSAEAAADPKAEQHPGILSESASEAGERHLVAAVPDLVRLTAHPNVRVSVRAGAALGLLKVATPEVLQALVRMTEGPSAQRHLVAIHALADLGTPDARRYLDNLATGHPDAALRELARERLRQLAKPDGDAPGTDAP
ncbi:MAG: hypothetical protein U1F43_03475 [Myxococcota bacterium]